MTHHDNPFDRLFDAIGEPPIEPIPLIGLRPVEFNERLWQLHASDVAGTLTAAERAEYDELCARLEAECIDANERQVKGAKL
jgi:hypothetical protein